MSIPFSNSTEKSGICELIDSNVDTDLVSYPIKEKTRDINLALDKALSIIIQASGEWQFDDSNHTADPIITTNLVINRSDYHYTVDEQGNLILDIYRVMVADEEGQYYDIYPVDQQQRGQATAIVDGLAITSRPIQYDKTGKGIYLIPAPNYSQDNGIKMFINRETTYFNTSDTTKTAGIAGIFHEYLAVRPSYMYAYRKGLPNVQLLLGEMIRLEDAMGEYYAKRGKDERQRIIPRYRSSR